MRLQVGFEDKLRLMSIVLDDLRLVRELPVKACRDCCFSTGGQYFAAINGNTIAGASESRVLGLGGGNATGGCGGGGCVTPYSRQERLLPLFL